MENTFKHWWMTLIKGIILILLSFFVFRHPIESLIGLAVYFGVALLITGVIIIITSFSLRKIEDNWGWKLAEGIIDLIFGFVLLSNPGITAAVFPFVVGFWMIVYGVMIFSGSFKLKKDGDSGWWISLIGGILTVLFGWFIMTNFFAGALAITVWIGLGLLLLGIVNIVASFHMKKLKAIISK